MSAVNNKKHITIFSDGSCIGNPGAGGYCAILKYENATGETKEKIIRGHKAHTTNNQMELTAVIEAIKALKAPCVIHIVSDSNYVVRGINEWLVNWVKKEFKGVKNPELWGEYLKVSSIHTVRAFWVKGHNDHKENEICDTIAKEEAKKIS